MTSLVQQIELYGANSEKSFYAIREGTNIDLKTIQTCPISNYLWGYGVKKGIFGPLASLAYRIIELWTEIRYGKSTRLDALKYLKTTFSSSNTNIQKQPSQIEILAKNKLQSILNTYNKPFYY